VTDLGARFPAKVTFHDGCHGLRELGIKKQPRALLAKVRDLQLVEMSEAETCCGLRRPARFPRSSRPSRPRWGRGQMRPSAIETGGADYIVSNDLQLPDAPARIAQTGRAANFKTIHLAEVLTGK